MITLQEIKIVPSRLIEAREKAGLSASEAARQLGIARQRLYQYEKGELRPLSDVVARMCKLYGVPISFLTNENNLSELSHCA